MNLIPGSVPLRAIFFGCLFLLTACSATAPAGDSGTGAPPDLQLCSEPRPEVCTQIYLPVCGLLENGGSRTYASDCSACSDPAVTGYRNGECP